MMKYRKPVLWTVILGFTMLMSGCGEYSFATEVQIPPTIQADPEIQTTSPQKEFQVNHWIPPNG